MKTLLIFLSLFPSLLSACSCWPIYRHGFDISIYLSRNTDLYFLLIVLATSSFLVGKSNKRVKLYFFSWAIISFLYELYDRVYLPYRRELEIRGEGFDLAHYCCLGVGDPLPWFVTYIYPASSLIIILIFLFLGKRSGIKSKDSQS